ncbi:MAG: class II aldolase/adducin family protein [Chloroflexi bacterium]|nr:class II aldolase/adducin family protein [Chloroflexota bacterium]
MSIWQEEKQSVVEAAREMLSMGLVTGTSGNVSVRLAPEEDGRELFAVTPTGAPYGSLSAEDIVVTDFDMTPVEGELMPSSEALLHVEIYNRRPDVLAVIHTHSVFSSVAAVAGTDIPPIIDEVMISIGGPIMVSVYAFPSSQELADKVCDALEDRNAALIRNHGAVGVGRTLRQALDVCALVERVSQIYFYASLAGKANTLPDEVVEAERAMFVMRRRSE